MDYFSLLPPEIQEHIWYFVRLSAVKIIHNAWYNHNKYKLLIPKLISDLKVRNQCFLPCIHLHQSITLDTLQIRHIDKGISANDPMTWKILKYCNKRTEKELYKMIYCSTEHFISPYLWNRFLFAISNGLRSQFTPYTSLSQLPPWSNSGIFHFNENYKKTAYYYTQLMQKSIKIAQIVLSDRPIILQELQSYVILKPYLI